MSRILTANKIIFTGNTQRFISSAQTITSAGSLTLAHGLGSAPFYIGAYLECTTANNNYSIGDKLYISFTDHGAEGSNNHGVSVYIDDSTNIKLRYGSQTNVFIINDKTTGTSVQAVNSNWRLRVIAEL